MGIAEKSARGHPETNEIREWLHVGAEYRDGRTWKNLRECGIQNSDIAYCIGCSRGAKRSDQTVLIRATEENIRKFKGELDQEELAQVRYGQGEG
jgi:hypothetical protein